MTNTTNTAALEIAAPFIARAPLTAWADLSGLAFECLVALADAGLQSEYESIEPMILNVSMADCAAARM
jgi:hypothetical protein